MKYRKKPVVVEAYQWFPGKEIPGVTNNGDAASFISEAGNTVLLSPGWYVIREVGSKFWLPEKPSIIKSAYEKVEESEKESGTD